jgi:hypothetical protein
MQMPLFLVAAISWCAFVSFAEAKPVPFDQHGYPTIDIRVSLLKIIKKLSRILTSLNFNAT